MREAELVLNMTGLCKFLPSQTRFSDKLWDGDLLVAVQVDDGAPVQLDSAGAAADTDTLPPSIKLLRDTLWGGFPPRSIKLHFDIRADERKLLELINNVYDNVTDTAPIGEVVTDLIRPLDRVERITNHWCSPAIVTTVRKFLDRPTRAYDLDGRLIFGNPPDEQCTHNSIFKWLQGALLRAEKFSKTDKALSTRTKTDGVYFHACLALLRNPRIWRMGSTLSYICKKPQDELEGDWMLVQLLSRWRMRSLVFEEDKRLATKLLGLNIIASVQNPDNAAASLLATRQDQMIESENKDVKGCLAVPKTWAGKGGRVPALGRGTLSLRYGMLLNWAAHAMKNIFHKDISAIAEKFEARLLIFAQDSAFHHTAFARNTAQLFDWRCHCAISDPGGDTGALSDCVSANKDVLRATLLVNSFTTMADCFKDLGQELGDPLYVSNSLNLVQMKLDCFSNTAVYVPDESDCGVRGVTAYYRYTPEGDDGESVSWEDLIADQEDNEFPEHLEKMLGPQRWGQKTIQKAMVDVMSEIQKDEFITQTAGLVVAVRLVLQSSVQLSKSLKVWHEIASAVQPSDLCLPTPGS